MNQVRAQAPTLETDRLILRHYRKQDFRPHAAIVTDPGVMRHFSAVGSLEDTWRRMSASAGSWSLLGFGGWAVIRKSDERLVGNVALFNAWRNLEPEFGEAPEMGWIFAEDVHGQGIAGEACRAALSWAEASLDPTPIWAIIAPSNLPSMKLADRLGFEQMGETSYNDEPTLVLKRPAWG